MEYFTLKKLITIYTDQSFLSLEKEPMSSPTIHILIIMKKMSCFLFTKDFLYIHPLQHINNIRLPLSLSFPVYLIQNYLLKLLPTKDVTSNCSLPYHHVNEHPTARPHYLEVQPHSSLWRTFNQIAASRMASTLRNGGNEFVGKTVKISWNWIIYKTRVISREGYGKRRFVFGHGSPSL